MRRGVLVVALYLATLVGTLAVHGGSLPLFEGFGPPPNYEWVHPPAAFASGNVAPKPVTTDIPLTTGPSAAVTVATPDGQFVVDLAPASFPPHPPDTSIRAVATPLDPKTLGALPVGSAPDGNAYRLMFTYQPSGSALTAVAAPGDVTLNTPYPGAVLEYSPDGRAWAPIPGKVASGQTVAIAPFTQTGWFVAGHHPSPSSGSGGGIGTLVVTAIAAGLLVLLGGFALSRRGQRVPAARGRPPRRK